MRKQSNEFYEPERKTVSEKHAFLRCVDLDEKNERDELYRQDKLKNMKRQNRALTTRTSNNDDYYSRLQRSKSSENSPSSLDDEFSSSRVSKPPILKSIKEFSYFDWSKVKLFDTSEDFFFSEQNRLQDGQTTTTTTTTSNKHGLQIQNFQNENKIKELPQVITIRFI